MSTMKSFTERLADLERRAADIIGHAIHGTSITRVTTTGEELEWSLAIGGMHMPQEVFTGKTMCKALEKAEAWAYMTENWIKDLKRQAQTRNSKREEP